MAMDSRSASSSTFFTPGGERELTGRSGLAPAEALDDTRPDRLGRYVQRREGTRREALLFAGEPEQQMLRPHPVVAELTRLVLRENDGLSCKHRELAQHPPSVARLL